MDLPCNYTTHSLTNTQIKSHGNNIHSKYDPDFFNQITDVDLHIRQHNYLRQVKVD
jgi:hypothetical protein